MQQGIELAIDEINRAGGVPRGRQLRLVTRDNRAVTAVAADHLHELAAMPDLVAVLGGKYSPIFVECLPVAHELRVLLLDPWGSADRTTDHPYRPSYTFRLSLKDEWAAPAFVQFARQRYGARALQPLRCLGHGRRGCQTGRVGAVAGEAGRSIGQLGRPAPAPQPSDTNS